MDSYCLCYNYLTMQTSLHYIGQRHPHMNRSRNCLIYSTCSSFCFGLLMLLPGITVLKSPTGSESGKSTVSSSWAGSNHQIHSLIAKVNASPVICSLATNVTFSRVRLKYAPVSVSNANTNSSRAVNEVTLVLRAQIMKIKDSSASKTR